MSYNTIPLAGDYRLLDSLHLASGQTPKPGMLLKETSDGELTVHATSGGDGECIVCMEDSLQGKTVADAYTAATICRAIIPATGSEFQALVVAGENIAIGDYLMSNGDGKFAERTSTNTPYAVALEACDLSDSGDVDTLCRVRKI